VIEIAQKSLALSSPDHIDVDHLPTDEDSREDARMPVRAARWDRPF
jgi:hypothetical protein